MDRRRASGRSNLPNYAIHVVRLHGWVLEDEDYKPVIIKSCGLRKCSLYKLDIKRFKNITIFFTINILF